MKLFQQKTCIEQFCNVQEFIEEFPIRETDFIIASKTIYEKYFKSLELKAKVAYKSDYGMGEPTDVMIDGVLRDFRSSQCTRIIAIGGGAVIDMAKVLVLAEPGDTEDFFQCKVPLVKKGILIAVPTTCGAGSEVSGVTIAEMTKMGTKLGLAAEELYPDYAILIPELLRELPFFYFATSAIDALIHAIESYVSPKASVYTQICSLKAAELIISGFRTIVSVGESARLEQLEDFLLASTLAGTAFSNAGTGAVHALSVRPAWANSNG